MANSNFCHVNLDLNVRKLAMDLPFIDELRRMNKRQVDYYFLLIDIFRFWSLLGTKSTALQIYYQVLNFGMIVSTALMIWKGLMILTGSESPIVVVLRFVFSGWKIRNFRSSQLFTMNFNKTTLLIVEVWSQRSIEAISSCSHTIGKPLFVSAILLCSK